MPDVRRPGTTREQLGPDKPARDVRGRHPGADLTDPPPADAPAAVAPSTSPQARPTRRPAGAFIKDHLGTLTLKDLMYVAGLIITAVTWAQSRASRDDVEAARRSCVESTANAIASALAPVPQRLKVIEKKQARNETRWDRLDAFHARVFAAPNRTPPPKFGPTAEKRGEVRYEDEEDE
jgi:hypothetical protein